MINKFFSNNQKNDKEKNTKEKRPKEQKDKDNKDNKKFSLPPNNDNNGFNWKNASKTSIMWIIIIVSTFLLFSILGFNNQDEVKISTYQYEEQLRNGNIQEAEIVGKTFHGTLKEPQQMNVKGNTVEVKKFSVELPVIDSEVVNKWEKNNLQYDYKEASKNWTDYIISFLPWILIIGVWIFFLKRMQGGGKSQGIFGFGKSKAKLWTSNKPKATFDDVAGCDEAKEELEEIIEFLKEPEKFRTLGGKIPKGALLVGPPGTGKTLLARAVAGESGRPFFSLSGSDFVEMFVGVGASRVRDLFEKGKKNAPCIIFIDEIDAVGRQRGAGVGGGHDEREQTLNQLLNEMDGFDENIDIILLAATNRPDVLDKALLRPGRFDRQIIVDSPDIRGREGILEVHTKETPLADDVDLEILAKSTPGLVGADLANMVNEAALLAAKKNKKAISMQDFEEAKDKIMMGKERSSLVIPEEEKELTAYHEAGHTLVTMKTKNADPLHKVTIIPRGRAMGVTHQLPIDDRHNYSKSYIMAKLDVLLGGRAAEQIVFNELSTGAGNDIEQATKLARKMVTEWGMSEKMGPLTFGKKNEEVFLGREISRTRNFSENTAKLIDEEVKNIVSEAEINAKTILGENREVLDKIANQLLEYETLTKEDIDKLMNGEKLDKDSKQEYPSETNDKTGTPEKQEKNEDEKEPEKLEAGEDNAKES
ncbi:MAG: ATP-dependent zinc metalloprotease FtsH [Candidatus Marinimicrobia bacterium]|nr:ATP-dependent zinc metalloprotease FtsH [Candidatus Neomarinimicrobiota bacterium]